MTPRVPSSAPLWARVGAALLGLLAIPIASVAIYVLVPLAVMAVAGLAILGLVFLGAVAALDDPQDRADRE
jgi:predicted benzoate:H+ symporter BenE